MKYILTIVFATAIIVSAVGQGVSGIYLTVQCAKKSERFTVAISSKQVCIAQNPIIPINEFTSVSDVMEVGDKLYFDLTLSNKAIQTMAQLQKNLPEAIFAFKIQDDVFSTFPATDLAVNRTFRFQGNTKHRSMFADAQKKLKTLIESRTQ